MKQVFADTNYWVALLDPNDQFRPAALAARQTVGQAILVTTDEVLSELLSFFCADGAYLRDMAVNLVKMISQDPGVQVLPQTRDSFLRGLQRYEARPDKEYSLADCISMEAMEEREIQEVLTNDHHFTQEGFTVLIRP